MTASLDVSVVVLNYNGVRWLPACLDALAAQRRPPLETIVVDNGSTDDSAPLVRRRYPAVRLIETHRNLGYAGGNNAGARSARGAWLAFLNNDTIPAGDWMERLFAHAAARPDYALVTSRIAFLDDPALIDSAGDGYLRAGGAFKHGHHQPSSRWQQSREVFGACGAAFMIRREVFESLEGFDERFFMVYEDVDLSYRARLLGHRCWYAADAVVHHAGSGTMGRMSALAVFHGQRNLEWTWAKNTPWPLVLTRLPGHLVYSVAGLAHYARHGKLWSALSGKLAAIAGLPAVLRERRRVQSRRVVKPRDLDACMERRWLTVKRREKRPG